MTHRADTFSIGERVQAHPATDTWMRGDRFGVVEHISKGRKRLVHVRMDISKRLLRFSADNLLHIGE